jgi:signal transduction histidine kinase
MCAWFV